MEHILDNSQPSKKQNRESFVGDMTDFLCILFKMKVEPDFHAITKKWYETENGQLPTIYYMADDEKISEKIFKEIMTIVNNADLRSHNEHWDIRIEKNETLYANKLTDNKIIAQINHILRTAA